MAGEICLPVLDHTKLDITLVVNRLASPVAHLSSTYKLDDKL